MYNAAIKLSAITLTLLAATACGSKSQETIAAEQMLADVSAAITAGNPDMALATLDSLQKNYPQMLDIQREALKLRPKAIESATMRQLSTVDSLMACYQAQNESLTSSMKLINDKDLVEPYYVATAAYNPRFLDNTAIQPRVNEIGQFYIISSVNGRNLRHNSITLQCNGAEVSTSAVPYDGESNYRSQGSEMVTYLPEQCDTLGFFASEHSGQPITLIFNGESGKKHSVKLSDKESRAIADAYNFSQSIIKARDLAVQRQKLERQLQIARDQMARTADR